MRKEAFALLNGNGSNEKISLTQRDASPLKFGPQLTGLVIRGSVEWEERKAVDQRLRPAEVRTTQPIGSNHHFGSRGGTDIFGHFRTIQIDRLRHSPGLTSEQVD